MILEKDKKRYLMLRKVYEECEGIQSRIISFSNLAEETGLNDHEMLDAYNFLKGEDLIKGQTGMFGISITHKGITEVENSIRNPDKPTEHFPTQIIQNFHAPVGSVQTGNQNVANVQQNFGSKIEDIFNLLKQLQEHIPDDKKEEGVEYIQGIEAEVKSEKPSESRIKLFLNGLGGVIKDTGKELLIEVGKKVIKGEIQLG